MDTKPYMSRPIREVIRNVALAIAEGQSDLNRNAVAVQKELERSLAGEDGSAEALELPHYRFSEVDVSLNTTMSITAEPDLDEDGNHRATNPVLTAGFTAPSASSSKDADVEAEMTSKINFKIVPTSPPRPGRRGGSRPSDGQSSGGNGR